MKNCWVCGHPLEKNENTCHSCGASTGKISLFLHKLEDFFAKKPQTEQGFRLTDSLSKLFCLCLLAGIGTLSYLMISLFLSQGLFQAEETPLIEETPVIEAPKPIVIASQADIDALELEDMSLEWINEQVVLSKYSGNATELLLPDYIHHIGPCAFQDNDSLNSISMSDSVLSVGEYAFSRCFSLETVHLGDSVWLIGEDAFANCQALREISLGTALSRIENWAFSQCSSLEQLTLPDSIRYIGAWAFNETPWYEALSQNEEEFSIHSNGILLKYNGEGGDVVMPNTVKAIAGAAFGSANLSSLEISDGVVTIDKNAFTGAKFQKVHIPNSVVTIEEGAFSACVSLKSLTIPSSVTHIADWAFEYCSGLKTLVIPASVQYIGEASFLKTTALEEVYVTYGSYAHQYFEATLEENPELLIYFI